MPYLFSTIDSPINFLHTVGYISAHYNKKENKIMTRRRYLQMSFMAILAALFWQSILSPVENYPHTFYHAIGGDEMIAYLEVSTYPSERFYWSADGKTFNRLFDSGGFISDKDKIIYNKLLDPRTNKKMSWEIADLSKKIKVDAVSFKKVSITKPGIKFLDFPESRYILNIGQLKDGRYILITNDRYREKLSLESRIFIGSLGNMKSMWIGGTQYNRTGPYLISSSGGIFAYDTIKPCTWRDEEVQMLDAENFDLVVDSKKRGSSKNQDSARQAIIEVKNNKIFLVSHTNFIVWLLYYP